MFTGIIQSKGEILACKNTDNNFTFTIATKFDDMNDVALGDSIAMNGVCLTVTKIEGDKISADVSRETTNITDAKFWQTGTILNLEKSLALKDKLGGHMVSGHVDTLAKCVKVEPSGTSVIYGFKISPHFDKFVVKKGSVAINGVSLTVNEIKDCILYVNLIPHTLQETNLGQLVVGDEVNFEIDTIARYVEKMVQGFTS
ncbi:MAG: riboflavin synthase [Robiginitomaculum sp.]|nr:MAG: riboflavin synthase [Robiginitomaculum sp.]